MKKTLSLLAYYWKSGSWGLWGAFAACLFFPLFIYSLPYYLHSDRNAPLSWEMMMATQFGLSLMAFVFPLSLGFRFFLGSGTPTPDTPTPFPEAEFLLSKPVTRREAHRASRLLYYGLIFLMILPPLLLALFHPSIPASFHPDSLQLPRYREAFPQADVLSQDAHRVVLFLPRNAFLLYLIPCLIAVLSASTLQGLSLIRWSVKSVRYLLSGLVLLPFLVNTTTHSHLRIDSESLYLAFVRHAPVVVLAVAALFLTVQFFSVRRAESADIL